MEEMIRIESLSFSYRKGIPVLYNIDLSIKPGEVVGLLGPNGSGKTTLIELLNGVLKPDNGTISIDGFNPYLLSPLERARKISYLVQRAERSEYSTVFDTVIAGRRPYRAISGFSEEDYNIVWRAMAQLDILSWSDRRVSELSGGEFQRVLIARIIAQGASLVLCDEPAASLDVRFRKETLIALSSMAYDCGVSLVISLHDINQALNSCSRIVLIHKGTVRFNDSPENLNAALLSDVYGTDIQICDTDFGRVFVV